MTAVLSRRRHDAEPASDATLIAAIPGGDLGALGELYDRHAVAVWRVVHRVTNGSFDVDDLVHATFLKVPELAQGFDGRGSARSWLIGIGVRLALRHGRSLGRFARMLSRFSHVTRTTNVLDPETQLVGKTKLAALDRALTKLPLAKRAVFVMVELEGLSHDEVARELGIPLPTVRTRLFHAKQSLTKALRLSEGA